MSQENASFDPRTTLSVSGFGTTNDGYYPFFPATPCYKCGKFVGRDGWFGVETFEMSNEIASVEGVCGRCLARGGTTE